MKQHKPALAPFLLLASLVLFNACSESPAVKSQTTLPRVKVRVQELHAVALPFLVEVPGTVQAGESAQISARVSGQVTAVPVNAGSRVKKNELLVKISAAEIGAQVQQAETQLSQAKRNLEREERLLNSGASTRESVKSLREMVQIREAAWRESQAMLNYTSIRAPFDGLVTRKFVEVGDLAAPGKPLLQLENRAQLEALVPVPEALITHLSIGDSLQIHIPAAEVHCSAEVMEIAPTVDPTTRTTQVKLLLPDNPKLRSGQFARISLPGKEVKTLLIPARALQVNGQLEQVFVADNEVAHRRLVRTGTRSADQIEILSGLEPGDKIILSSAFELRDGQPLQIVEGELEQ